MSLYRSLLFATLLLAPSQTIHAQSVGPAIPVDELLREDGTLDLNRAAGSIDIEGWQVSMPGSGPPVFSKKADRNAPAEEIWEEGFGAPGLGSVASEVEALAVDESGNLYAGGTFTGSDGAPANYLASWDGRAWTSLGWDWGPVYALVVDSAGDVYIGGECLRWCTSQSYSYLARWDGFGFWPLGAGVNGTVRALAIDADDNLYVGGSFTAIGSTPVSRIAKWTGSWSTLGSGVDSTVYALAVDSSGNVYAGGDFLEAGGSPANRVAQWNGTSWAAPLGLGINGTVYALAVDTSGIVYAGGGFDEAGGVPALNAAVWNGSTWSPLWDDYPYGLADTVRAMVADQYGNVYMGGDFPTHWGPTVGSHHVLKYDGTYPWGLFSESDLFSGIDLGRGVRALAIYGGPVCAPGEHDPPDHVCVSDGELFAGGSFETAGGQYVSDVTRTGNVWVNSVARYDGTAWSGVGSEAHNGVGGIIYALVGDGDGNLYAGGRFNTAGGVWVNNVAKWDGTSWGALGEGLTRTSGGGRYATVYALALDALGNLFAGGDFDNARHPDWFTYRVARWDGTSWSPLGSGEPSNNGVDGTVYALAVYACGTLYVGGAFQNTNGGEPTTPGVVPAEHIAKWDGTSWSPLGSGMNADVRALAMDQSDKLYAGGDFTSAGGVTVGYVAMWTGTSWNSMDTGVGGAVKALAVENSGNVYAAHGGGSHNSVSKWDGVSWTAIRSIPNEEGDTRALAVDAGGALYRGGAIFPHPYGFQSRFEKWDGSAWSEIGVPDGAMESLALDADGALYVGGSFSTVEDGDNTVKSSVHVAKWLGTSSPVDSDWSRLGSGLNGRVNAIAADGEGGAFVGGQFTAAGCVAVNHVARWDGSRWNSLGPGVSSEVHALALDASGNLYAGGDFLSAGVVTASKVAMWDGTSWSALGEGLSGGPSVLTLSLDRIGYLYAGGEFTTAGLVPASNIAMWDGVAWNGLGSGVQGDVHSVVLDDAGNLYAGGNFAGAGGAFAANVAKWDGTGWSSLDFGMNDAVETLAIDWRGDLYAGGHFTEAVLGVPAASHVAKWDGSNWIELGTGVNQVVHALTFDGRGKLYAGGEFTSAGAVQANYIATWDGTTWVALDSGTGGPVYALDVGSLWIGGNFTSAGGKVANHIAKWDGPLGEAPAVSATAVLEGPYTGSGQMSTALNAHLPTNQPFSGSPWFYAGSESVPSVPANAVDWLLIELRSDSTAESTFNRQAVLLLSDGTIVDTSGVNTPSFWGVPDDSVYVVLRSRNHLAVMTPAGVKIAGGVWTHSFTSTADAAYSDSGAPLKELGDGYYGLFAGDANADEFIQALDFNDYIALTTAGASGYQTADFNLDGQVQALDFNLYIANTLAGASGQVP